MNIRTSRFDGAVGVIGDFCIDMDIEICWEVGEIFREHLYAGRGLKRGETNDSKPHQPLAPLLRHEEKSAEMLRTADGTQKI